MIVSPIGGNIMSSRGALGAWRARRGAKHGAKRTPECADPEGGTPKVY